MTTNNCRKRGNEAETESPERNSEVSLKGATVDKAEREQSFLPNRREPIYIPEIKEVVSDENIQSAIATVKRNKGAPGIDGITVEEIEDTMEKCWSTIKQEILEGRYNPSPVRRVEIPKPDGYGVRQLGIPTVMDRIIQQALYQKLYFTFDPTFSENSYGFRRFRKAQDGVLKAKGYIQEGYDWCVDVDLEKFFDQVNHDILMSRVARRIKDKKILLLIRRYLQAGVMEDGLVIENDLGVQQGGPLSPLLSNIMLDDLDVELERRGLRFARYADDCNIYVKSERAGKRIMESITKFLTTKLKLKVNQDKSAVARPWDRKFLGFTFIRTKEGIKIAVHESRVKRLKDKVRKLTKKMRGSKLTESIRKIIMPITRGWVNYFLIAEVRGIFKAIDGWIRRKIRAILWRQWKKPKTRYKALLEGGVKETLAKTHGCASKGAWRMSRTYAMQMAISNKVIESMGYIPMEKIVLFGSELA